MNKLAVIYARVSTSEQSKGYSLPTQIKGCTEYAQRHNLDVVAVLEEDVSGATRLDERESGARLIEMAERGLINAVIVWRLDRLSRPPEGEYSRLLTTIEQFARYNVSVHECETGEVKSDLTSVMVAFFKGLAASQERAAIRERTMRGIKAKAQAGKWVGQGDPPYGYRKVGTSRDAYLEIHPERAAVVRRIFDLYIGAHGRPKSLKQIAILLTNEGVPTPGQIKKGGHTGRGGWYPSTISRSFISNAMYIGRFEAQGFVTEKPELAIIDDETWTAAQKRREVNVRFAQRNRKRDYLLAGHIRCACGGALVGESKKRRTTGYNVYYRCPKHRYDHIERCPVGYVRADRIEPVVWQWLKELLSDPQKV
ncbi:MAG: recombinase family protein, partial [Anaerolineae bacterium]|nr:recombinase family protein [Anaerolineae bacterium]